MKITWYGWLAAVSFSVIAQTASADVILTDNFHVTSNNNNVNQNLAGRETGTLAPTRYTGWTGNYQVGNTTTGVGQPGGAANGDYLLLAFYAAVFSDMNICSASTGPLTIEYDLYNQDGTPAGDATDWSACGLRAPSDFFPVAGGGEFGFLVRRNGGIQAFQGGNQIAPGSWDTPGFASAAHFKLVFDNGSGGSAFNGTGSEVTFYNGGTLLGTIALAQLNSAGLRLGWQANNNVIVGVANLAISGTTGPLPGRNLSFEYDPAPLGAAAGIVPTSWIDFNEQGYNSISAQEGSSSQYSVNNPLGPPADGSQFCYINQSSGVGGIYQDMGPLQSNTIYTLTVAIGQRADAGPWAAGTISLISGTDNTGTVLAAGGGLPPANTWQDYSVTYTNISGVGDLTAELSVAGPGSLVQANFDNVRLTTAPFTGPPPPPAIHNPSFEAGTGVGAPIAWTAFNYDWMDVLDETGGNYPTFNPLAAPADGNNLLAINAGPGNTAGIYQVYGALQTNTVYTLTVAIGYSTGAFVAGQSTWSPGIISLIHGNDNNGAVLATGGGLPATQGIWQDYTASYTTGTSVSGNLAVELSVLGAPTYQAQFDNVRLTAVALVAPAFTAHASAGNLILTGAGGTPNGSYTVLTTTNLTAPIVWSTSSTGNLNANGAISNSIPINTTQPASFFKLIMP